MNRDIDSRLIDYWLDSRDIPPSTGNKKRRPPYLRLVTSLCLVLLISSCATLGAIDDLVGERLEYYLDNYELVVSIQADGEIYEEVKEALECVVEDSPACEGVSEEERQVLKDSIERTSETRESETVSGDGWEVQIEPVEPLGTVEPVRSLEPSTSP